VIDKFRDVVSEKQLQMLTVEQRKEMGDSFARQCTGLEKDI